jgi:hypothetical protein
MHCRCTNSSWGSACSLIPSQAKWQPRVPQISYSDALYTLRNRSSPTGLMYDHDSASAWFDYVDPESGARHQVWLDTPSSLAIKYSALRQRGVRGVSWWTTDGVRYPGGGYAPADADGEAAEMWDALSAFL